MESNRFVLSAALAAIACLPALSDAQAHRPLPGEVRQSGPVLPPYVAPPASRSGTWKLLKHAIPNNAIPETALLLTDGTVLVHSECTADWYRLKPDRHGSYIKGTWTQAASMQSGYTPLYFASQVLADGRVIVNGGEYINCSRAFSTDGAIFDPVANTWTQVAPPEGWTTIGDAQSAVLADGTYMLADCCSVKEALAAISGNTVTWTATGTGKFDVNDEEGWTVLPDQTLLTVDTNRRDSNFDFTEIYAPAAGTWTAGQDTASALADPATAEIGPAPLLPNGYVLQLGGTGQNNVFNTHTGAWTAAPSFPNIDGQLDSADGPAAVLPDGNILAQVSPGVFTRPSHFFEISVKTAQNVHITQVSDPLNAQNVSSFQGRMLVLPTGQVLLTLDLGELVVYTPKGNPKAAWLPTVTISPPSVARGSQNNVVQGTLFNGLTQGGYYGDDAQMATNYPLVRFTNIATGDVCYARTHDHSAMGISTGGPTSTEFDVPGSCEAGASNLEVVANGIASAPVSVTLN